MIPPDITALSRSLEEHFRHVHATQMQDVPLLNPLLQVEAVDFQTLPDNAGIIGVLITPWFMNLLWVADTAETFVSGNTRLLALPSGEYSLNANHAANVGTFYSVSLFSPVLQFTDHAAAVLTAQQIMLCIMATPAPAVHNAAESLPAHRAVSRRDFLRGKFA